VQKALSIRFPQFGQYIICIATARIRGTRSRVELSRLSRRIANQRRVGKGRGSGPWGRRRDGQIHSGSCETSLLIPCSTAGPVGFQDQTVRIRGEVSVARWTPAASVSKGSRSARGIRRMPGKTSRCHPSHRTGANRVGVGAYRPGDPVPPTGVGHGRGRPIPGRSAVSCTVREVGGQLSGPSCACGTLHGRANRLPHGAAEPQPIRRIFRWSAGVEMSLDAARKGACATKIRRGGEGV
jgi:hypothetical protein